MSDKTLKVGEKYVKLVITEGGIEKRYILFKNPNWTPDNNQPGFRANSINHSIALWVNTKKEVIVENVL